MLHRRPSFRPRSIRGQLARLVVVAILVDLSLLTVTVVNALIARQQAADTSTAVNLEVADQAFMHEMQKERGLTVGLLGGGEQFRAQLPAQRQKTDAALTALQNLVSDPSYAIPAAQLLPALQRLSSLQGVRDSADHGRINRNAAFQYFTDTIQALNAPDLGFDQADDASLRYSLLSLRTLGNAKEFTGEERALLNGVFAAGRFDGDLYVQFNEIRANKLSALSEFDQYATSVQRGQLDAALGSPVANHATEMENVALSGASGRLPQPVNASDWYATMTNFIDELRTVQLSIGDDAIARVGEIESQATWELTGALALALLTVGAEVVLVISASRSIIKPLEDLAAEADDMSTSRLPEAVAKLEQSSDSAPTEPTSVRPPERASTEIQLVADAFDRVQRTAFTLASKQAVLRRNTTDSLANLGRRNQNLVRRQLSLISKFEYDELDPSALANLFTLDHLATRMRRNAESLLVLVGEANPRRWSKPLPITDILRAAVSEVEDYRRVTLRRVDEVHLVGAVATEVAHMLAELIENGLAFSPPETDVEIYARRHGSRYVIAVVDQGVGMSDEEIDRANARLRGDEHFLVAPTRFLGHYVVGGLARGLDAHVELARSPIQGITARAMLPENLLVRGDATPGPSTKDGEAVEGAVLGTKSLPAGESASPVPETGLPHGLVPVRLRGENDISVSGRLVPSQPTAAAAVPSVTWPVQTTSETAGLGPDANGSAHTAPQAPVSGSGSNGLAHATPETAGLGPDANGSAHATPQAPVSGSGSNGLAHAAPETAGLGLDANGSAHTAPQAPVSGLGSNGLAHAAPETATIGPDAPTHTQNGLVKRVRKQQASSNRPTAPPARSGPQRSPDEVRAMLSAFHTGHRRGEQRPMTEPSEAAGQPASLPEENDS